MSKQDLTNYYQETFALIQKVINNFDPESFKPGKLEGTPVDEYEIEIVEEIYHK